jgi:diguanylate cyclase (GGDEF)-like protein/PAS domain S-box-containing protein
MLTAIAKDAGRTTRRTWLRATLAALLISLAGLVAVTILFARQAELTLKQTALQADLSIRLRQLQGVLVALVDAETGQRGYLLTQRDRYLIPYTAALAKMPQLLTALDDAQLNDGTFRIKAGKAKALVALKLAELAETIRLRKLGRDDEAKALVMSDTGQNYMEQARVAVNEALDAVRSERDQLAVDIAAGVSRTKHLLVLVVALLVLFVGVGAVQIALSLAARARFETALAHSEQRHRAIVEEQSELVSLSIEDGTLVYVNPAYCRHFGCEPGALVGTNLYDGVEPADRLVVKAQIDAVFRSGEARHGENRVVSTDGNEKWVAWTNRCQRDAQGVLMLHSVGRDITERKRVEQRLADSEKFVRQVTDNLPVRIAYLDTEARYRFVNLAHCKRFGKDRDGILGRSRSELMGGTPDPVAQAHMQAVLRGEPQRFEFEESVGGQIRRIESQLIPDIGADGAVRGFYTTGVDITERVATERALRGLSATLRSVTEAIPALVAVVGFDGRYRFVNGAFERWAGARRESILGQTLEQVLGRAEYDRSLPWVERVLAGETVNFEKSYAGRGHALHLDISYIPLWNHSEVDGFVAVAQDITQHKEEEGRLIRLARRDALTGVLNRAGFEAYLKRKIEDGGAGSLALLYVDLDHFKAVNDQHGHPVGDQVLRLFAQRLENLVRPTDAVARLGGDEFTVGLAGVREHANAETIADKIVAAAAEPFVVGALVLSVGASVGVAFKADDETGWQGLIDRADVNLYKAKAGGRGQHA